MQQRRSKLSGNGLWESSRMMLPEHIERIRKLNQEEHRKERPVLDEQRLEDISLAISESIQTEKEITFVIFGEYEDREVTGYVSKIDQQLKQIKVTYEDDYEWVKFLDIIEVRGERYVV